MVEQDENSDYASPPIVSFHGLLVTCGTLSNPSVNSFDDAAEVAQHCVEIGKEALNITINTFLASDPAPRAPMCLRKLRFSRLSVHRGHTGGQQAKVPPNDVHKEGTHSVAE